MANAMPRNPMAKIVMIVSITSPPAFPTLPENSSIYFAWIGWCTCLHPLLDHRLYSPLMTLGRGILVVISLIFLQISYMDLYALLGCIHYVVLLHSLKAH